MSYWRAKYKGNMASFYPSTYTHNLWRSESQSMLSGTQNDSIWWTKKETKSKIRMFSRNRIHVAGNGTFLEINNVLHYTLMDAV